MGWFAKKAPAQAEAAPQPQQRVSATSEEVAQARDLIDEFEQSLHDRVLILSALSRMGQAAGYRYGIGQLQRGQVLEGDELVWQWLLRVCVAAGEEGDGHLVGRIFLFMYLYVQKIDPIMEFRENIETGVFEPEPEAQTKIATRAIRELMGLPSNRVLNDTIAGKVTVDVALGLAKGVVESLE